VLKASWVCRCSEKGCTENLSIMLFTRYYKKYSKVGEAKETVDLKIWHHKYVIYRLGNVDKNRNTQSDLGFDV